MSGMPYFGGGWQTNSRLFTSQSRRKDWVPYSVWRKRQEHKPIEPEPEINLTYSAWQAKGRRIHKGRKARGFQDGEALFNESDTYIPKKRQ